MRRDTTTGQCPAPPAWRAGRISARVLTALFAVAPAACAQQQEFRGMWVTRFEWPDAGRAVCQSRINTIMSQLAANGFNAVLFQVRGQADTLYPSPNEPWSPLIGGRDPGWDPLAYAITAAHTRGLEFHAYINTHPCWQSSSHKPPADGSHLDYRHCNAADPAARDWLLHDADGQPVQYGESDYVWMAPGVPDFQAYIRQQVLYVVKNYDVDGVHFDRIRTPDGDYSHDPISVARFNGAGNPDNLDFHEWTCGQFTRMLRDMYAAIMALKPHVKVSCSPLGLYRQDCYPGYPSYYFYGYTKCHQDAQAWIKAGAMDFLVPMIYWPDGDGAKPDFSDVLPDWLDNAGGRHIYAGSLNRRHIFADLQDQIEFTRSKNGPGNVVFSWSSVNSDGFFDDYRNTVYRWSVSVPDMPWKTRPTTGIVYGYVRQYAGGSTADDPPVVDAQVRGSFTDYVALSSGDGFYCFLNVPPGTHALSGFRDFRSRGVVRRVRVSAGQVVRQDIVLGAPRLAGDADDDGDVDLGDLAYFLACFTGPGAAASSRGNTPGPDEPPSPPKALPNDCQEADLDADADVDLPDFNILALDFTGPR